MRQNTRNAGVKAALARQAEGIDVLAELAELIRRLGAMLEALGERPGKSLPTAFQDWSNTKAAYRFFSNGFFSKGNVSEDKILEGHLDRASDAPPGTTVIWQGISRLADLVEGARIANPPMEIYG